MQLPQQNALLLSSFEWALRLRLGTHGVDVAVGAVAGEQLKASLRCMALWGRYVHCAPGKDGREATVGMCHICCLFNDFVSPHAFYHVRSHCTVSLT